MIKFIIIFLTISFYGCTMNSNISKLSDIEVANKKSPSINALYLSASYSISKGDAYTAAKTLNSNIKDLELRPEAKNLLRIYSSLTNLSLEKVIQTFEGKNFSEFKEKLSQVLSDKIDPISKEIKKLMNDKDFLDKILLEGHQKANDIASDKVKKMHEIIGF